VKLTTEQRLEQEVIESLGAPTQQDIITWAENAEKMRYEVAAAKAERRRKEAKEKFDRDLKMELAIASKPEKEPVIVPTSTSVRVEKKPLTKRWYWEQFKYTIMFSLLALFVLFVILGPQIIMNSAEILGQATTCSIGTGTC
jgi:hypothetical protein